jgi:superfamily I DNA and/or RNA helicase
MHTQHQGTEADVVIISLVRSTKSTAGGSSGISSFIKDARRLNVALSRAK